MYDLLRDWVPAIPTVPLYLVAYTVWLNVTVLFRDGANEGFSFVLVDKGVSMGSSGVESEERVTVFAIFGVICTVLLFIPVFELSCPPMLLPVSECVSLWLVTLMNLSLPVELECRDGIKIPVSVVVTVDLTPNEVDIDGLEPRERISLFISIILVISTP